MSFKQKLTLGVCLIVAGITTVLACASLSYLQWQLRKNVAAQQFVLLSSIAEHIDDSLAAAQDELLAMAKIVPLDILQHPGRAQQFLDLDSDHKTTFDSSVVLFSRDGTLIAETPFVGRKGQNFSYRDYFKKTIASGRPSISAPFLSSKKQRHPVIILTVPLRNAAGVIVGVLAGSLDLTNQNFLGKLARTRIGETGYLYLFGSDRTMIMHPDRTRILAKDVPPGRNTGFDQAIGGFEGTLETTNSKGVAELASFKRLNRTNWILAANFPQAEAYAAMNRARHFLFASLLTAILLSVVVVWYYLKQLTEPLQRFTDHVRRFEEKSGQGRFFSCATQDEIGILAENFNDLVRKLDAEREALLLKDGQLAEAQRLARVGNWDLDLRSGSITWSDEMYRLAGLDRGAFDLTLESFLGLVHPEDRPEVARAAREARQGGAPLVVEHRFLRPDGTLGFVHSLAEVTLDEDGQAVHMFGTVQDITQRKHEELGRLRAEGALKESEERLRQIAEHCKEVLFIISSDLSQMIYINPAYETLYQQSCQSLYERPTSFTDHIHEEDRARVFAALEQLRQEGIYDQTYRIVRPDRTVCWIHARTYPVHAEDGEVHRYVGIAEDVTEQKLGEEQIRKLQQAVEQSPLSVVITDCQGTIEYVNPKFAQLTGYSRQEAIGQNPRLLKSGGSCTEIFCQQSRELDTGATWHGELLSRRKNGETFWESVNLSPIKNPAGEITHYLSLNEDITARKLMEQELVQAKELAEEASRLKSEFLANMSHEIRTPMNGVIGMTDLLANTSLDREQTEYVQTVKSSAESLLRVINDILDFSKIEARQLDLESIPFGLRQSLGSMLNTLALRASEKGLELSLRVPPEVPDAVVGDPGRLRQVLVNLVSNAVKFTEAGEVLVSVSSQAEGEAEATLHFAVADTGIGIAAEKLQQIFDPFSQADASTTRCYGGTGLGLSISTGLVQMMGGSIWVESTVGQGSTFHFTVRLGLATPAAPGSAPAESAGAPAAACRHCGPEKQRPLDILLVEDNEINQLVAGRMLEKLGHTVRIAASGKEALAALAGRDEPFDLVLMDVQMPGMDGCQATALVRGEEQLTGAHLPIIALTAHAMEGDRRRCLEAGMDAYVAKPLKAEVLCAAIQRVLNPAEGAPERQLPAGAVAVDFDLEEAVEADFDHNEALARMGGNLEIFREVVGLFAEDSPKLLAQIRDATRSGDCGRLARAAHSLRGALGYVGAPVLVQLALKLEALGRSGELTGARSQAEALEEEIARLGISLALFLEARGSAD